MQMQNKRIVGIYWGRFNPPHKGHMQLIKKILKEVGRLIIAIGSAEFKDKKRNPFGGKERKAMMEGYLKEEKLSPKKVKVIAVRDGTSFSSAIKNLFANCSPFDVLYTDKATIISLIGKKVKVKRFKRKGAISSTQIRGAIAEGRTWKHLTGRSVARLIKKYDGIERIKKAYCLTP